MRVIRTRFFPVGYDAMNLFGVLFVHKNVRLTASLVNHERIHTCQMLELGVVGFYLVYFVEWVVRLCMCGFDSREAYRRLSFEREAYGNQNNSGYISGRRCYAMWR